jgi:hypothetical protein
MKTHLLLIFLVMATGCAKTGAPEPPRLLVPRSATDLAAEQKADAVVLRVAPPRENTDGSAVTTLREIEVFRLAADRNRGSMPISEESFLEEAERVLIIPAANLPRHLQNGFLVVRDDLSFLLEDLYTQGFFYAVRYINRKNQTAGLSNRAYIAPIPIPAPPGDLSAQVGQGGISLNWAKPVRNRDGSTPPRVAGYNVYRFEAADEFPQSPLNSAPIESSQFEDRDFQFGRTYYYAVTVIGSRTDPYAESLPSAPLEVVPRDTFAPSAPRNLDWVTEAGTVILLWVAPPEDDVKGYRVYRTETGSSQRSILSADLVMILSYRDRSAQAGKMYRYEVTAVDRFGNESPAVEKVVELP